MDIRHSDIKSRNSKKLKYILDNNILEKFKGKEKSIKLFFEQHYTGAITEQHLLASGNEIIENS